MLQMQWRWTGWAGGPGYTTLNFFSGADTNPNTVVGIADAFFGTISNLVPTGLSIRSTGVYRLLDAVTGHLEDEGSFTSLPPNHAGSGSAAYGAAIGMCVDWLTGTADTHRLRVGRTYLVPLTAYIFATDGTISDSVVTEVHDAAATLAANTTASLGVWKRPVGGAGGSLSAITGVRVPDIGVILRSRRR